MNPTDPDFPPRLRDHYPTMFENEPYKEAMRVGRMLSDSEEFARSGVPAERDRVRDKEQHVGSLALYATVTLKKLPKRVQTMLSVLLTLWADVFLSLGLALGTAEVLSISGFIDHAEAVGVFFVLWFVLTGMGIAALASEDESEKEKEKHR